MTFHPLVRGTTPPEEPAPLLKPGGELKNGGELRGCTMSLWENRGTAGHSPSRLPKRHPPLLGREGSFWQKAKRRFGKMRRKICLKAVNSGVYIKNENCLTLSVYCFVKWDSFSLQTHYLKRLTCLTFSKKCSACETASTNAKLRMKNAQFRSGHFCRTNHPVREARPPLLNQGGELKRLEGKLCYKCENMCERGVI